MRKVTCSDTFSLVALKLEGLSQVLPGDVIQPEDVPTKWFKVVEISSVDSRNTFLPEQKVLCAVVDQVDMEKWLPW